MSEPHEVRSRDDDQQPPRRVGFAVAAVALLASLAIPDVPVGLGITLVAFAAAGAVALGGAVRLDGMSIVYTALALALASMAVLRASEWVVALGLAAAGGLGVLAVTRAVDWRQHFRAPFTVLAKVGLAGRFVIERLTPRTGASRRLGPVLRGVGLGGALLLVFGALFASADRAFARLAEDIFTPEISWDLVVARIVVFGFTLLGTGALILAGRRYALATEEGVATADGPRTGVGRVEWMTALGLLVGLFVVFVAVQITTLFGGHRYVLETEGITYAENARQGFFQLLAVGVLTLAVVAGAIRWARRQTRVDEVVLRVLLGTLSLLTIVILASALRRLSLYEEAFGLTRLRLSVHATILWMAGIFVLLLVAGALSRITWLPRATVVFSALSILVFTLLNPEGVVARRNVERFQETGRLDLEYALTLGADAVPALAELPPPLACWPLSQIAQGIPAGDPVLGWNLSRANARSVLAERAGDLAGNCDDDVLRSYPGVDQGSLL